MKRTIYKRRDPKTGRKSPRWTIGYQMANGQMRYEVAFTDKDASLQRLAQREREVARGAVGLTDPFEAEKRRPIGEHLAEHLADLKAEGVSDEHRRRVSARLEKAFSGMGTRTLGDLSGDAAARYVTEATNAGGLSLATRNHLVATLRAFAAWCVRRDRLATNPLAKLQTVAITDGDRTEVSRVLTPAELGRLCDAAPLQRRRLYLFTSHTGFRRGEDKATTWADLKIDGDAPFVTIKGKDAKNGQTVDVPIPTWLAAELRRHRAEVSMRAGGKLEQSAPVFHVPAGIVRQLRLDAQRAGLGIARKVLHKTEAGNVWTSVEWIDPAGPDVTLKLHGLRAFYATTLFEAGTPTHEVQRLCRHASIQTTIRHYTAWRQGRMREAVDRLPDPRSVSVPVSVASMPAGTTAVPSWPTDRPATGEQALA